MQIELPRIGAKLTNISKRDEKKEGKAFVPPNQYLLDDLQTNLTKGVTKIPEIRYEEMGKMSDKRKQQFLINRLRGKNTHVNISGRNLKKKLKKMTHS